MKRNAYLSALCLMSAMSAVCCHVDTIDYVSDDDSSTGGTATGGGETHGSSSGDSPEQEGSPTEYRRSGYGGAEGWNGTVVGEDGSTINRSNQHTACVNDGTVTRTIVDLSSCTAATLCSPLCTNDDECPSGGTAVPRCVQCPEPGFPGSSLGWLCGPTASACVLECTSSSECPAEMSCLTDATGRDVCMFADTPVSRECGG